MALTLGMVLAKFSVSTLTAVVILVRMTLLAEIELIHFSTLSSKDLNYHNDIQLFLQQFEKFSVYCVTN